MAKPIRRGIVAVRAEGAAPSNAEVKALVEGLQAAFGQFKAEHTKQ